MLHRPPSKIRTTLEILTHLFTVRLRKKEKKDVIYIHVFIMFAK